MTAPPGHGQLALFPPSNSPLIQLDPNHRLVKLTGLLDWVELEAIAQSIRRRKLKSNAGRRPHLRALLGAVVLMATRRMTYRETEDQIRHYGPARYLCGLTDGTWTPDFTTIQDFTELMGEEGMRALNEIALQQAHRAGLLDPNIAIGDTTAQQAPMTYPTEVGLMSGFLRMVGRATKRAGKGLKQLGEQLRRSLAKGGQLAAKYRFFSKTKAQRLDAGQKMLDVVRAVQRRLGKALEKTKRGASRIKGYAKVARQKLETVHDVMKKLAPQIQYWLDTGRVARKKLVNLLMPEVCSIPRGKVGKDVEFGLKWGFTRMGGGFLVGSVNPERRNFNDTKHVVESVNDCARLFGKPPESYAYDRGGHSQRNVEVLTELGVQEVGLAPKGSARWAVGPAAQKRLRRERVKVEGSIGAIKSGRYTFDRPNVRSTQMLMTCGQRSVLGYNLNRLVALTAATEGTELVA